MRVGAPAQGGNAGEKAREDVKINGQYVDESGNSVTLYGVTYPSGVVGNYEDVFNLRSDNGQASGGLAVDANLGWKGPEKYFATVCPPFPCPAFDQMPTERDSRVRRLLIRPLIERFVMNGSR